LAAVDMAGMASAQQAAATLAAATRTCGFFTGGSFGGLTMNATRRGREASMPGALSDKSSFATLTGQPILWGHAAAAGPGSVFVGATS
jgi:hypothetical protein